MSDRDGSERDCSLCRAPIAHGTCTHLLEDGDRVSMSRIEWERLADELTQLRNAEAEANDDRFR